MVKIAVIGSTSPQSYNEKTEDARSVTYHLSKALCLVQHIMSNSTQDVIYFDFLVYVIPGVALHPHVLPVFMQTIFSLTGKRYCVHIQKVRLANYGILVDKSFIVILASRICTEPQWVWNQEPMQQSIMGIMGDLIFQNPRANQPNNPGQCGLNCKKASTTKKTVYNHNTGHATVPGVTQPVAWRSEMALKFPLFRSASFSHPGKFSITVSYFDKTEPDRLSPNQSVRIYSQSEKWLVFLGFQMILSSMMGPEVHTITSTALFRLPCRK